jgi:hypothetical protein
MLHDPILNPSRAKYRRKPSTLFVPPLLPTLAEGEQWEHELKYDGYRTLIAVAPLRSREVVRRSHDHGRPEKHDEGVNNPAVVQGRLLAPAVG